MSIEEDLARKADEDDKAAQAAIKLQKLYKAFPWLKPPPIRSTRDEKSRLDGGD